MVDTPRPKNPAEFREAFDTQRPTIAPEPPRVVPEAVTAVRCHECVSWNPLGRNSNSGQCHYNRNMGAPLYTLDLSYCSKGVRSPHRN